jgi:hypothetical protein
LRSGDGPPRIRSTKIYQTIVLVDLERTMTEATFGEVTKGNNISSCILLNESIIIVVLVILYDYNSIATNGKWCSSRIISSSSDYDT